MNSPRLASRGVSLGVPWVVFTSFFSFLSYCFFLSRINKKPNNFKKIKKTSGEFSNLLISSSSYPASLAPVFGTLDFSQWKTFTNVQFFFFFSLHKDWFDCCAGFDYLPTIFCTIYEEQTSRFSHWNGLLNFMVICFFAVGVLYYELSAKSGKI